MDSNGLKKAAENVLREMPFVVGAFVQPDAFGNPREIHSLIRPGPKPREVAHEVKSLLETRLRVPIDQRIISIAQLAEQHADSQPAKPAPEPVSPEAPEAPAVSTRLRLAGIESTVHGGRVTVSVAFEHEGSPVRGEATELEAEDGRARAGARAALDAINGWLAEKGQFGFDFAARVDTLDQPYVLVSVVVSGRVVGRRPVALAGAHPADEPEETAAALAVLKATNRAVELLLSEEPAPPRRRRPDLE